MPVQRVIIIGGGITGIAAALTLIKHNGMICSVFEIRVEPSTIGGAIGLTPNALRYLDHLGVLDRLQPLGCEVKTIDIKSHRTGKQLGTINFDNIQKFRYRGLRVMRHQLLDAMLATLKELGVEVQYNKKIEAISETQSVITATFSDGTVAQGNMLLGCDGIHSAVRTKFVQSDRHPEYSGVATAYAFVDATSLSGPLPFETSALYFGQLGSLLLTFADPAKTRLYIAAVMRSLDVGSREGWIAKGQEQALLKNEMKRRFSTATLSFMTEALELLREIMLYPVYRLPEKGIWSLGSTLLLGDAAHAMPPQGESVGLALEDVILLSRVLAQHQTKPIARIFQYYGELRRPRIDAAVKEANFGFDTIQDRGWLGIVIMEWLSWIFLLWRQSRKEEELAFDVRETSLKL